MLKAHFNMPFSRMSELLIYFGVVGLNGFNTFSHGLERTTVRCQRDNLGISPFAWEEWQEVERSCCWPLSLTV